MIGETVYLGGSRVPGFGVGYEFVSPTGVPSIFSTEYDAKSYCHQMVEKKFGGQGATPEWLAQRAAECEAGVLEDRNVRRWIVGGVGTVIVGGIVYLIARRK